MLEQPVPEGLHTVEEIHSVAVHEELQPVGKTHVGRTQLSPGRREGWGEGRVRFSFIFLLSYSDLICDKLNFLFLPKFSLFCP